MGCHINDTPESEKNYSIIINDIIHKIPESYRQLCQDIVYKNIFYEVPELFYEGAPNSRL